MNRPPRPYNDHPQNNRNSNQRRRFLYKNNFNRPHPYNNERRFNSNHRELNDTINTSSEQSSQQYNQSSHSSTFRDENTPKMETRTEQEIKIDNLISTVQSQPGIKAAIVLYETENDSNLQILQNSITGTNQTLNFKFDEEQNLYSLLLNDEVMASGKYASIKDCKLPLATETVNLLKPFCFHILQKSNFGKTIPRSTPEEAPSVQEPTNNMMGGKAHQMMLKMGWGGKGLGAQQQGVESSEVICKNVSKKGLTPLSDSSDILGEISKILKEYAESPDLNILGFDSEFSKEERAHIHQLCVRYNLKSKSYGKQVRVMTVRKRLARYDMVRELLKIGGENESFLVKIPPKFEYIWKDEEDNDAT